MLTAEQIMASHKTNIETLFGLTQKAFEGVEKLVELNMQATKAALAETANHTQAVMGVKDAQELLALQASLVQPLAEKTAAYSRHLYDIASAAGADLSQTFEGQAAEAQKKIVGLVDSASQNAPAGSDAAVAVMKAPWLLPPTRMSRCKKLSSKPATWPKATSIRCLLPQ
jgi:phasin family protein